jgi:RNA methyltransferase, TrmH family
MPLSSKRIKSLRSLQLKKYRDLENRYLLEGVRLLEEALASPVFIHEILVGENELSPRLQQIVQLAQTRSIAIHNVDPHTLASLCDTESPQGIVAVAEKSVIPEPRWSELDDSLLLILDQLHDPGNLGTILRTAEWFGVQTVVLSQHTVELYNPKVVRSSMGALFRLRCIVDIDLMAVLPLLKQGGYEIVTSVLHNGETTMVPLHKTALVIGGEAEGVSAQVQQYSDRNITIPCRGRGESLNAAVAAGILLDQLTSKSSNVTGNS